MFRKLLNGALIIYLSGFLVSCTQAKAAVIPTALPSHAAPQKTSTAAPNSLASPSPEIKEVEQVLQSVTKQSPAKNNATLISPAANTTGTPDTRQLPKYWSEWPLIPLVSARTKEIYRLGQELGNDPHSFSTIGDCQSVPSVFMGTYDTDEYVLGKGYEYLEETIKQFHGSFKHDSISVKDGLSVASVLSPMWSDPKQCSPKETPLECELRIHKPVIMFINLGTNWNGGDEVTHEKYMRQVVDILLAHGVIPILSSKGDNQEGGHRINQSIARVAYDYDIPFWNFWRSIRDLPGKGIDGSREGGYLTPEAWGRRSFTGLMALDTVWREIKK
jgi:hypothetical protein